MQCTRCEDENWHYKGKNHEGKWIHECLSCGERLIGKENPNIIILEKESLSYKFNNNLKNELIPLKTYKTPAMHQGNGEKFANQLLIVFILYFTPVINWPLDGLAVFFHELSHGLVALLFGGRIEYVEVFIRNGLIYTHFDNNKLASILVSWSGYTGAGIWGLFLYRFGLKSTPVKSFGIILCIIFLVGGTTVYLVNNKSSQMVLFFLYITLCLSMLFLSSRKYNKFINHMLRIGGLYIIVDSFVATHWLLYPNVQGDDTNLEQLTGVPEIVWIFQWVIIGMLMLGLAWFMTNEGTGKSTIRAKRRIKRRLLATAKA